MSIPDSLKTQCKDCGGTGSVQFYPAYMENVVCGTMGCPTCGGSGYTLPSQEDMAERIGVLEKKAARLEAPLSDDDALDLCHASQDGWRCAKAWFAEEIAARAAEPVKGGSDGN